MFSLMPNLSAGFALFMFLAAGCAAVPAERAGSLSGLAYEPGPAFEDRTVALLGAGLFLSESLLAPGLADPEARLLQAAESLVVAARSPGPASHPEPPSAGSILKTAFSQVGLTYRFGGTSPLTGFDCSGFVGWVYGQNGVRLPRSSPEMLGLGQAVARHNLVPGDLVFFGRKKRVTHVGIYTGNNRYIHSPSRGKPVQESSLDDRARGEYYIGARRLLGESAGIMAEAAQARAETRLRAASGSEPAPAAGESKTAALAGTRALPAAKAPKPAPKTPARTHKIRAGDTLYDLARKYGLSQAELARANKLDQKRQASLRVGQVLAVPAKPAKK